MLNSEDINATPIKWKDKICDECDGEGKTQIGNINKDDKIKFFEKCWKCKGKGKLDWIDILVNNKPKNINGCFDIIMTWKPVIPIEYIKLDFIIKNKEI